MYRRASSLAAQASRGARGRGVYQPCVVGVKPSVVQLLTLKVAAQGVDDIVRVDRELFARPQDSGTESRALGATDAEALGILAA
jgi:hypothetical protein